MTDVELGIYKHYKGKMYEVVGVAHHSETKEEFVVYYALYPTEYGEKALFVRPLKMFVEDVVVDGKKMKRFAFVGEP